MYIDIELSDGEKMEIEKKCYDDKFPIPNFYEFSYNAENETIWQFDESVIKTECKLPVDYEIFVLEAKKGKFVNDSLLSEETMMPKSWEHGLSKGVAIDKANSIIIYWLNIW